MTRKGVAILLMGLALTGARPPMRYQPDPSSVIAAEIAFNRLAQQEGQWTAFRATADKDAVLFMPQRVPAQTWLKGRADPPASMAWSPSIVYVSCDGNLAASTGNWKRADGKVGYFTTIWRRDKKGAWKWIADHGDTLATLRDTADELTGRVATCKRGTSPPDDSLTWSAEVAPDGSRRVMVKMWTGETYDTVIDDKVGAGS